MNYTANIINDNNNNKMLLIIMAQVVFWPLDNLEVPKKKSENTTICTLRMGNQSRFAQTRKFGFIKRVHLSRITPEKDLEGDLSSVSPSSERIEELWVIVGFYKGVKEFCHCWKCGDMNL